jgi:hypothetical protein
MMLLLVCRDDNVLKLELDAPERPTYDYYDPVDRVRAESHIHQCFREFDKSSSYLPDDAQMPVLHHPSIPRPKSAHGSQHNRM